MHPTSVLVTIPAYLKLYTFLHPQPFNVITIATHISKQDALHFANVYTKTTKSSDIVWLISRLSLYGQCPGILCESIERLRGILELSNEWVGVVHALTNCSAVVLKALAEWDSFRGLQLAGLKLIVILTRCLNDEVFNADVIKSAKAFLNGPLMEFQHQRLMILKNDHIILIEVLKVFDNMSFSTKFVTKSSLRGLLPQIIEILSSHLQKAELQLKGIETINNIVDPLYVSEEEISV